MHRALVFLLPLALTVACSAGESKDTPAPQDAGVDTAPPVCAASAVAGKPICALSPGAADPCQKEASLRYHYTCNQGKCPEIGCKPINPSDAGSYSFWCCQTKID